MTNPPSSVVIPETSICRAIVLKRPMHFNFQKEIQSHSYGVLLSSVHSKFCSQLHHDFALLHLALVQRGSENQLRRLVEDVFGGTPGSQVQRLFEIVKVVEGESSSGVDLEEAIFTLLEFRSDIMSRYCDFVRVCRLRFKKANWQSKKSWLKRIFEIGGLNVEESNLDIISEGLVIKERDFSNKKVCLISADQIWYKIKSLLKTKVEGFCILVW